MKILVAEDQPIAAMMLRRELERQGHEVEVVGDGEEAWNALREGVARVLISDWVMPRLDGPGLCKRVRLNDLGTYIYVILLTALDRREDRLAGLQAGADDFLTKPPDRDELAVRLEVAGRILAVHEELARKNAALAELAATDALTGLWNRRSFDAALEREWATATRMGTPLSLLMLDVDRFKAYNDRHGHLAGDAVLREVGAALAGAIRPGDMAARYGGEEFVVLLPGASPMAAMRVAARTRAAIADRPWRHEPVTASVGVATTHGDASWSASDLVGRADAALYKAKEDGRDRVACDLAPCLAGGGR